MDITYVVGAGAYPYRIDGRRLSESEAISILMAEAGETFASALRALHLVSTAAVRDADLPQVTRVIDSQDFRIEGGEPLPRLQAAQILMREWRLTSPEAAKLLDNARLSHHASY